MSADAPRRRTDRMHLGRVSAEGAAYFITVVTKERQPWLKSSFVIEEILNYARMSVDPSKDQVLAITVMPDHVHLLLELGGRLSVGQWVARFKSQTCRRAEYLGRWQRDFWEHRIREIESLENYGLYVFLNPYRAGLIGSGEVWTGWWVADPSVFAFLSHLENGCPAPEWLAATNDQFDGLAVGE